MEEELTCCYLGIIYMVVLRNAREIAAASVPRDARWALW